MRLKPTPPSVAKDRYLTEKESYISQKTYYNYNTCLRLFVRWLTENGIEDMRDLDGDTINAYKEHRLANVKPITARNDFRTIKAFTEFCGSIQAVSPDLFKMVRVPKVKEADEICDVVLTKEEADALLVHLAKYEYADSRHVIVLLLWKTGMRVGGLHALDWEDVDFSRPALELRHRPESRTPLKRKEHSERDVLVTETVAGVLEDYYKTNRPDVTDDFGREPLVTTPHGRMTVQTLRNHIYRATSPCFYTGECPFGKRPAECDATTFNLAYKCPGSVSPHALRRGYVTAARNAGQPKDVTGERVNMSGKILDKHYDKGSLTDKAERRREFLEDI